MGDVFADIAAVQSRIAEITGASPAAAPAAAPQTVASAPVSGSGASFNAALASALGTGGFPSVTAPAAVPAPAPVAPAQIDALVQQNASTWQVEPSLVKAIIANESGFNASATSGAGAQGLMQLMPQTAASVGVRDPYDPAQNVAGGTRYLRSMLDRFGGDLPNAIAAYNAGPEAVEKYGGIPPYPETQNYVRNVLDSYRRYRAASPTDPTVAAP